MVQGCGKDRHACQNKAVPPLATKHLETGEACILKKKTEVTWNMKKNLIVSMWQLVEKIGDHKAIQYESQSHRKSHRESCLRGVPLDLTALQEITEANCSYQLQRLMLPCTPYTQLNDTQAGA